MGREELAARIGSRYMRNAMLVGLGLAASVFILMSGGDVGGVFRLMVDWPVQAFICVVIGPFSGHVVGGWAGRKILLEGWNAWLMSPVVGFVCVWVTTFLFSLVAYFDEGRSGAFPEHAVRDYILNPMISVTMFGGLFIFITGLVVAALFSRAREKQFA